MGTLAVITGASSGIGEATARELVARGYTVVLTARRRDALEKLAETLGENALVEACDAGDGAAVLAMAERVQRRLGVPSVIVHCAGAGEWDFIEDTAPSRAMAMMQAPYFAAFNVTHAFMRGMLQAERGVIIHVNSVAAVFPWPSSTGYTAARWALRGLHEALSQDLAGTGVRSCHLVLGRVASPYFANNPGTAEKLPAIAKTTRRLSTEECARMIARLAARPRNEVTRPFMLLAYRWTHALFPWLVLALLRWTGVRRARNRNRDILSAR